MKFLLPTLVILSFLNPSLSRGEENSPWLVDYEKAVEIAEREGKDILLVFTGTDWIEMCRVFYNEILSQPEFLEPVSEEFVLVKLEYPKDGKLPPEEAAQKALLRDAYRVRGFPMVVLSDWRGLPFGLNGYQPITPEQYAKITLAMEEGHEESRKALEEAESLEGIEKAKKLIEGIPDLPGNLSARYYGRQMQAVVENDPENTLEQTPVFRLHLADVEYSRQMQLLANDVQWEKMIELTDRYIAENKLTGEVRQKALHNKAGVQMKQDNLAGMVDTLLEIVKIDPESEAGQRAQEQLDQLRAQRLESELAE